VGGELAGVMLALVLFVAMVVDIVDYNKKKRYLSKVWKYIEARHS